MDFIFDDDDSPSAQMTIYDRLIFWIGGTAVFFITFLLIAGSLKSEKLRKQPGDLIIAIALSDFVLSILWIIQASWADSIDSDNFCTVVGAIVTFAGMTEFLYNMAFNIFLIVSLRNALKQDRIPKKSLHVFPLLIATIYLIVLLCNDQIGKTAVGTCSISTNIKTWLMEAFGPIIVVIYAAVGFYTYYYIRKNAPTCAKAHSKRTQFLLYYLRYVVASTIVYAVIAIFNGLAVGISSASTAFSALYNLAKICSPLVLSFIRFNDPLIKKTMIKALMFWRKPPKVVDALVTSSDDPDRHPSGEFVFNQLAQNLKVEITYTLLSCVLYADFSQEKGIWETVSTFDRKSDKRYKHERLHLIGEGAMRYLLPSVREELDRTKYNIMPGTLKVYAPEVFSNLTKADKDYFNIQDSLDFGKNREEILNAIKPGGGKSGEFFFFSKDKKLIIKTIPDVEMQMLVSVLRDYDEHLKQYPNSLIAKVYGAYTFESTEYEQKFNLIVMKNICGFPSACVERIYDMKGSRYDREVLKDVDVNKQSVMKQGVLKDLDFEKFEKKLNIRDHLKEDFIAQMEADSLFFRRVKLIDYSFMVFCVNKKKYMEQVGRLQDGFTAKNPLGSMENTEEVGMYYNVGIVDYLQPYNFQKAMERSLKKFTKMNMSLDTSSQNPQYYSTRFIDFIKKLV